MTVKAARGQRRSRLASSDPIPMQNTMTDSTTDVWWMVLPIRLLPRVIRASS